MLKLRNGSALHLLHVEQIDRYIEICCTISKQGERGGGQTTDHLNYISYHNS